LMAGGRLRPSYGVIGRARFAVCIDTTFGAALEV
jgi:hypothetical protein